MTETRAAPVAWVCPTCRGALTSRTGGLLCLSCNLTFPIEDGIADFSQGRTYDNFVPGQELSPAEREGLENEIPGAVSRVRDYYLSLLRKERGPSGRAFRILDSGCGNGLSVDILRGEGFEAWGADLSALRKWQWRERRHRDRLCCADSGRLPFSEGFFDAVLCSGVIEHVGVRESGGGSYSVTALPDRDAARAAFLAEHARILAPGGVLWLDFPNGAFPIDFWHGPRAGGARWHGTNEGFLPTAAEIRRYAEAPASRLSVRAIGASERLQFRQVGRHWYGKLLGTPARLWLKILAAPPFAALLETGLNPFLVLELRRSK